MTNRSHARAALTGSGRLFSSYGNPLLIGACSGGKPRSSIGERGEIITDLRAGGSVL